MSEAMIGVAARIISERRAGEPILSRLSLLRSVHKGLTDMIKSGASPQSIRNTCRSLRYYFAWCDREGRLEGESEAFSDFTDWCNHLIDRANGLVKLPDSRAAPLGANPRATQRKDRIDIQTALDLASAVSRTFTPALGIERPIVRFTRLPALAAKARAPYKKSDAISFGEASNFGRFLVQICDQLTVEKVRSSIPVQIELESGHTLTEWCKLKPPENVRALQGLTSVGSRNVVIRDRKLWEEDGTVRTRYTLVNLRIECELLIFLSQTGMNLAQAHSLGRTHFRYQSADSDIHVSAQYKARRGGDVNFTVFKEYKKILQRYLEWLDEFVPIDQDDRLFPFYYPSAIPAEHSPPNFSSVRIKCKKVGLPFVGPQKLRSLRVNWFRVRSSDAVAAEVAQHTERTLRDVYVRPSHPVAASEINRFHAEGEASRSPPAAGDCASSDGPSPIASMPEGVTTPDCLNAAGCMFCKYHRDVSSFDYAWSLVTYQQLKRAELATHIQAPNRPPPPVEAILLRVSQKVTAFAESSAVRGQWIEESRERVTERNYHPFWAASIEMLN
ncbi:hypothetical protein PDM28_17870 [Stenotrophomonas aracearum]|uniref:Site-specific integrase n=1 Tax=Stenotrophomonas aracearum TaxID=3003272 RepID=A0ABY9YDQ3_9GAMM|nr:hypothetical protein [Stenotrophomonas sp. A5588]WNH48503.1 hypothetical protein PDM28_17870 [Stenotrophomonas sp. A5588]